MKPADQLSTAYLDAKDTLIQLARLNVNEFASYVLRDEVTHRPIDQGPTHRQMQALCDDHRRLILWSYTGAGKTQQIAVVRTLWLLMHNPRARVVIISNTKGMAAKIVRTVANYIENSVEFREVAPHVRKGEPWTQTALYLRQEDGGFAKDPAVQACGIHGNLTGSRADAMIWDDILDPETVKTQAGRDDLHSWLKSAAVLGRVTPDDPIWVIGNAYHPDDSLHRLASEGWAFERLPVVDERGQSTWPERWPLDMIERKRIELGPLEFARQMLCRARDDSEARFKRDDLIACAARGRGLPWVRGAADLCGTPWPLPPGALTHMPAGIEVPRARGSQRSNARPTSTVSAGGPPVSGLTDAPNRSPDLYGAPAAAEAGSPRGEPASWTAEGHAELAAGSADEPTCSSLYSPPPLTPGAGVRGHVQPQSPTGSMGQGPRALADREAELFPDASRLARPAAANLRPDPGLLDADAPAWLAARQHADAHAVGWLGARAPEGGRGFLRSSEWRPKGVLDSAHSNPAPGLCAQDAQDAQPHNLDGLDSPRAHGDHEPTEPAASKDDPGFERALDALAGRGPHGSLVAAMWDGEVAPAEAERAYDVARAAMRLGGAVRDLRVPDEASRPPVPSAGGVTVTGRRVTGARAGGTAVQPVQSAGLAPTPNLKNGVLPTGTQVGGDEGVEFTAAELPQEKSGQVSGGSRGAYVASVVVARESVRWGALDFPADAGEWLDTWAAAPGTPHRRSEDNYPVHPRSLVGLRRMGIQFHTGVDLAVQRHSAADFTVLYTIAVYPPQGKHGLRLRRVCEIQRGRWYAIDICRRILDVRQRFGGKVLVENNAAQQYLIDIITQGGAGLTVPEDVYEWLRGYTTGRNKASPEFGIGQLAAEFAREQWAWPLDAAWRPNEDLPDIIETNWNEILYFDPRTHTGDVLMGQWLAKESVRLDEIEEERKQAAAIGVRAF